MKTTGLLLGTALLVSTLAATAQAQAPVSPPAPPAAARAIDRSDLRHQIYVMEGALARAVSSGAQSLARELRSMAPEMMALSGDPQARGVYLDGYGVFFDVGVPVLHQSALWTFRTMMGQDDKGLADAIATLKAFARTAPGAQRAAAENAIGRLELQLGPLRNAAPPDIVSPTSRGAQGVGAAMVNPGELSLDAVPAPSQQVPVIDRKYLQDPNAINRAYTEAVHRALVGAMIDYSLPMAIAPDEYLTVAARDNMQRDTLAPPDPYEEVVTLVLRIKGADLAAYRRGQIDRDEVRKRVQLREF